MCDPDPTAISFNGFETETPSSLSRGESVFLVTFFNFYFYLGLIPFKTIYIKDRDAYVIETFKLQKFFCLLQNSAFFFYISITMYHLSRPISFSEVSGISAVFEMGSNISSFVTCLLLMNLFWRNKEGYLELIESTRLARLGTKEVEYYRKYVILLTSSGTIFFGVMNWLMLKYYYETSELEVIANYKLTNLDKSTTENLTSASGGSNSASATVGFYKMTTSTWAIFVVTWYAILYYCVAGHSFLCLVLSLREMGRHYVEKIEKNEWKGPEDIYKGFKFYRKLKRSTDIIKRVFGDTILFNYITFVSYYAQAPHVLLGRRGEVEKFVLAYYALALFMWILGAEFHHQVRKATLKWVEIQMDQDLSCEDRARLLSISNDVLSINVVALKTKCFTVSYNLISSMLGLVVTYGIIVLQLHMDEINKFN